MSKKSYLFPIFIVLTTLWWGWTSLVDFIVVRTVFGMIDNFFQAGELGIALFSKLNNLEIVVSTVLILILGLHSKMTRKSLPLLALAIIAWSIPIIYYAYLTPKILELTALWKQADLMGLTAVAGIPDIQQEHHFYHNLYIGLDAFKLLLLTTMLGLGIWKQEQWV